MNKVTDRYFSILKDYFGLAYKLSSKKRFDLEATTKILIDLHDNIAMKSMLDTLSEDLNNLDWSTQETEIRKLTGLKASYIGSKFSYLQHVSSTSDFLRKTALYAETVIVRDQIINQLKASKFGAYIPTHHFISIGISAIELLTLEHLFTSDLEQPICAIAPPLDFQDLADPNGYPKYNAFEKTALLFHASKIFGKEFSSIDDFHSYLSSKGSLEEIFSSIASPELLVFPTGEKITLNQIKKIHEGSQAKYDIIEKYGQKLPPEITFEFIVGNQCVNIAGELTSNGKYLPALATDLKGVWNCLTWMMNYDNNKIFENANTQLFSKDNLVINALQQEDLKWLGNVPLNKIYELRANGELGDLRELLSTNIQEIQNVRDEDFLEVGQKVKYNIEQAIKRHSKEVRPLNEKFKRLYKLGAIGTASSIVSGTMGLMFSAYPPLAYSLGVLATIVGGESVFSTVKEYLSLRDQRKELKTKPVAFLFDAKRKAEQT